MSLAATRSPTPQAAAAPSTVVAWRTLGPWELTGYAAQGEFSTVFRARPLAHGERAANYALKLARTDRPDRAACAELLAREAAVAAQVAHPHLISVLSQQLEHEPKYLVMPWLAGASLARRLADGQGFALPAALSIVRQAAGALAALAAAEFRHSDVKPANILVSPAGHATLLDLGFARHRTETPDDASTYWLGTPGYAAPERFISRLAIDPQSDVYSLGVTLYRLLAGRLPFVVGDLAAFAAAHVHRAPADLREYDKTIPCEVAKLTSEMLAKEPLRRPTAEEVLERLARLEIQTFTDRARYSAMRKNSP
jgi:serine/threonine protein kinase